MMIGVFAVAGPGTKQSTDFEAAQDRQIEVENDQVGRAARWPIFSAWSPLDAISTTVSPLRSSVCLTRPGNVVFVFNDETRILSGPR